MNEKPKVLVVCGPTASGKTAMGVRLCEEYGGEVVSADSMQIYSGMNIATAKPTESEMRGIPHHLIGIVQRNESFSVADYLNAARGCINDIHSHGKLPVVVGGTGLYITSLVNNVVFDNDKPDGILRKKLEAEAENLGGEKMLQRLALVDPETASSLHPNNLHRIIRALEAFEQSGIPLSEQKRRNTEKPSPFDFLMLGIDFECRADLYDRIDRRVDLMLSEGLEAEARECYENGDMGVTAAQAIGLKELVPYFKGELSLAECVEIIKRETRRYAKRQLTWFRRDERICEIIRGKSDSEEIIFEKFKKNIAKRGFL